MVKSLISITFSFVGLLGVRTWDGSNRPIKSGFIMSPEFVTKIVERVPSI